MLERSTPTETTLFSPHTRPIRMVHAKELGDSVERFYTLYAAEPLIVKGVFADNPLLQSLTREKLEQLFQGQRLQAYERTTQACSYDWEERYANRG